MTEKGRNILGQLTMGSLCRKEGDGNGSPRGKEE